MSQPDKPLGAFARTILGLYLLVVGLFLSYLVLECWPTHVTNLVLFGYEPLKIPMTADLRLILLVMCAGGLGSWIHMATSFADFAGNRKLQASWVWWYVYRPLIGAALAAIFYFVLRAGFGGAKASLSPTSKLADPFVLASIGGMVGLFARAATDKLSDIFDAVFRTPRAEERGGKLKNAAPKVAGIEPAKISLGQPRAILVSGSNYVPESVIRIDGADRVTKFGSASQLEVELTDDDVRVEGILRLRVHTPQPGGGDSDPSQIHVT